MNDMKDLLKKYQQEYKDLENTTPIFNDMTMQDLFVNLRLRVDRAARFTTLHVNPIIMDKEMQLLQERLDSLKEVFSRGIQNV